MTTFQCDSKGVQTDPCSRHSHSKLLKTLQRYITAVCRYRLYLFNQYTQSDESYEYQDLVNVRKQILNRFEWVIIELEEVIEKFQAHQLSEADVQQNIDQPLMKEAIETALNADLSSADTCEQVVPNKSEWQMYKRDLRDTKEDLYILDLLVHRGISKIDGLMNITNHYI